MNYHRLASWLVPAAICSVTLAVAAQMAPAVGQAYTVDGRCVTLTQVDGDQVSYEWREGNAYGSGYGPPDMLGPRCKLDGSTRPAAPAPARPPVGRPSVERPPANTGAQPDRGRARPTTPLAAAPTGAFAQEALQAHNRLRCMHGVPALQWSAEVAAYAQRWADNHGSSMHSDTDSAPLPRLGENIASGYDTLTDAVADWYAESKGFDYRRAGYQKGSGHFTALIWKGVRYVGCGRKGNFMSCNYFAGPDPAPCDSPNFNMDTCSLSQVLPPARSAQACQ